MPSSGRPSAADTRTRILAAARRQFAGVGFARTTMRSVAAEAGVDPALVVRYFTSKAGLFAAAADLDLAIPDLTGLGPDEIADVLVRRFFEVWEDDDTFVALLRAAAADDDAVGLLRRVFADQVVPALSRAAVDQPEARAALVGSQVLGFALVRYVLKAPPLVAMTHAEVRAWVGPTLAAYLTAPLPAA